MLDPAAGDGSFILTALKRLDPATLPTSGAKQLAAKSVANFITFLPFRTSAGETNLPDGTDLMISIDGGTTRYNASSKAVVQGGHFQSETFTKQNSDLEAGQYTAEVLMPVALVQSPSVRAVIGEKGENLKGSLVEQGNLGVTVSSKQPFQLGADGSIILVENKAGLATAEKNALSILEELKRL